MKKNRLLQIVVSVTLLLLTANLAMAKTVTLSWDASPSQIAGYKLYYKAGSSVAPLDGVGAAEGGSPIDVGNVLTYTLTGLPDSEEHFFTLTAYDAAGYESSYSNIVTSPVVVAGGGGGTNNPPVLTPIGSKGVAEGDTQYIPVTATDPENDSLTYSATNLPTGATFNATTRTFSWSPDYQQAGNYSVTFSVSDGSLSDSETVTINVANTNRAPVLSAIGTKTVAEGSLLSFTISGSDPENDGLTYSAANLPLGASFNPATRQFVWTPDIELTTNTRVYPVTFSVSDGVLADSETVTINVTNVNRAPLLDAIGPQSLTEGDSINLVLTASDPDGDALTYSATNLPTGAVFIPSTRSFSWIPDNTQAGAYDVTFRVSDASLSNSEIVTISVANGNEAPVLDAVGAQTISENSPLSFVITASDPNNDDLTFFASGLPTGATFDAAQQRFSWTPDYTQAGSFSVSFLVSDAVLTDSETVNITVVNTNLPPTISGSPGTSVMARIAYSFTPTANDPDGDDLSFSIANKPVWASFDQATGTLSGTAADQYVGSHAAIQISASDGSETVVLSSFTINVSAYVAIDSDNDGVLDNLDAFPNDPNEWLDTDGDQIGNNADADDDNDGVADERDGAPLDASKAGWILTATAGTGGYITPDGNSSVLYGGSQQYTLIPMAGYYVNALLVDNVSVGTVASYQFVNVTAHHAIEAVFAAIPNGLSVSPTAAGLAGVERVDAGDDSGNLVNDLPKLNLDYRFAVVLRDPVTADQRQVYLLLDGYRYPLQLASGSLANGALYTFVTRLGPAYAHSFHFIAEDTSGNQLWRYPASAELAGPRVELLDGKNVVGIPGNIDNAALDSSSAFNVTQAYRWLPADKLSGSYQSVDASGPVIAGEGYVLKRMVDSTLPSLDVYGELAVATHEIQVKPGWNLIANPYRGNVTLADVQLKYGSDSPVSWLAAVADTRVVDGVYYYLGKDWGDNNAFASAAGPDPAILTPWIGYWIYLNPTDQPVSLLIPKPQQ